MTVPVIVLGAGGHAKVLIDALLCRSTVIEGVVDPDPRLAGTRILGVPVLGPDQVVDHYLPSEILLVNALGSVALPEKRERIFTHFRERGFGFATVIHPSAVIASDVVLGEGAQVMAGAVVQPGCRIGVNCIVNTRASVDHDCLIGDHVHIAPGATLSGGVSVGAGSHLGTGATVIQGIGIGERCLVAAGAVVVRNLRPGARALGVPAREVS